MARKGKRSEDSLDLLLDTICNTFGGILFISMLVVILLAMSSESVSLEPPDPDAHRRMVKLQDELARTKGELESLQRAAGHSRRMRDRFTSDASAKLAALLGVLTSRSEAVQASKNDGLGAIANAQKDINETLENMQRLKAEQQRLQAELSGVQAQLEAEIALRSQTSQLPKQRRTARMQLPFLMKNGRLYAYAAIDPTGGVVPNARDVQVLPEGAKSYLEPIAGAGLLIDPASDDLAAIEGSFAPFDKERYFVALVVWPDSFAQCQLARTALVRAGYEYQLIPWTGEKRLYISVSTERGGTVQ